LSDARPRRRLIELDAITDIMALRTYSDRSGSDWNVWDVQPPASEHVQEPLREGWLCFQRPGGGDRYRLPMSDVPPMWEELPDERLELMRRMAALGPPTRPTRRFQLSDLHPDDEEPVSSSSV